MGWWARLTGAENSKPREAAKPRTITIKRAGGVVDTKGVEPDGRTFEDWVAAMEAKATTQSREPHVRGDKIDPAQLSVCDLRHLASKRTRIVGSSYVVSDAGRSKYGGTEYLLVREPKNKSDPNAVAIYGKGRKVGYASAAKAATLAPLLDSMSGDAFLVGGTSTIEESLRLWVDLPTLPALREFAQSPI